MPTVSIATKRLSKTVNGKVTQFYYNGNVLSAQKSGNDVIYFMYDNNADIFGFIYNGTEYFYVKNAQNDVVAITDSTGEVIANYYYDDWGKLIETTGNTEIANLNPIRYRSYYYDGETGWYYLNTRYYDPEMSRFVNVDGCASTGQGLLGNNMFAYCGNNPVMRVDYGGEFWDTVFDVVSLVTSVAEVAVNPTSVSAWVGLAADVVCLVTPGLTGGGAIVKAITKVDDAVDTARKIYKAADKASDIRRATGSYEIMYKSGKTYVGKGGYKRAIASASKIRRDNGVIDSVVSISWNKAPNSKTAFMNEYISMCKFGGPNNRAIGNANSYNKIWSPGRKYYYNHYKKYYWDGENLW